MENAPLPQFNVSEFIAILNQSLDMAFGIVEVVGEVSSFKVNQNKYVFFDLKDAESVVGCFMMVYQLRTPLEDGMKVVARVAPRVTKLGKFSLTVQSIRPLGEGSIKKSFEILKKKLDSEGLFSEDRKRTLPTIPGHIGVISSTSAAGYADFIKILNDRWGGVKVDVAHVQVQGERAPDQIIRAIRYFNTLERSPEVLAIVRGGGSADDLAAFNDELLVREIAASRVPTLVGVGHEVDETLADMVADVRAATPSNAAQLIVPDKNQMVQLVNRRVGDLAARTLRIIDDMNDSLYRKLDGVINAINDNVEGGLDRLENLERLLNSISPVAILERGYAIIRGEVIVGNVIEIETHKNKAKAKIEECYEK